MPSLSSLRRKLRAAYRATPLDDIGLDDVVAAAEDYVRGPMAALFAPGSLLQRDTRSAIGRTINRGTEIGSRTVYEPFVDPLREIANREIDDIQRDPKQIVPRLINPTQGFISRGIGQVSDAPGDNPWEQFQNLGRSYRERPDTLEKRVVTNLVDPMNLLGVIGKGAVGPRLGRAAMEAFASAGLQTAGGLAGERIGGRTGGAIGELAGLVGGNFSAEALQAFTRAPRTAATAADAADASARIARRFSTNPDGTVSLHSGIPLSPNLVGATVGGALGGMSAPDDASLQERAARVLGGAAAGYAGTRLVRSGAAGRTVNELIDPSRNLPKDTNDVRQQFLDVRDVLRGVADSQSREIKRDLEPVIARAQLTPEGLAALRAKVSASSQDGEHGETAERLFGLHGGVDGKGRVFTPVVIEHPEWFQIDGQRVANEAGEIIHPAVQRVRAIMGEAFQREREAGVWDRNIREWTQRASEYEARAARIDRLIDREGENIASAYRTAPLERQAGKVQREADMAHGRAQQAIDDADALRAGTKSAEPTKRGAAFSERHGRQFHALGRDLDVRVGSMGTEAERARQTQIARSIRRIERFANRAQRYRDQAAALRVRAEQPVEHYIPHRYGSGVEGSVPMGAVTVGGRKFFENERSYASYLDAALAGEKPIRTDTGDFAGLHDLALWRLNASATSVADRKIVDAMRAHLEAADGRVLPDFAFNELPESARKGYIPLEGVKLSPKQASDVENALLAQMQDALVEGGATTGYLRKVSASARGRINQGAVKFYVKRDDWGRMLQSLDPVNRVREAPILGGISKATDFTRELVLSGTPDQAVKQALWTTGVLLLRKGPIGTGRVLLRTLRDSWDEASFAKFQDSAAWARWAGRMRVTGEGISDIRGYAREEAMLPRAAARGGRLNPLRPFAASERFVFERWGPALLVRAAESIAGEKVLTPSQERELAHALRKTIAGVSREDVAIGASHAAAERLLLNSPNFLRRELYRGTAVFRGGIEGSLARRTWASLLGMTVISSAMFTAALNDELTLGDVLDPTGPESVLNPSSRNFLAVVLPGGVRINPFAEATSLLRTAFRPVSEGIKTGTESVAGGASPQEVLRQVADTATREALSSGGGFVQNRLTVPAGQAIEQYTNRSRFPSQQIVGPDDSQVEQWAKRARHLGVGLTPAPLQNLASRISGEDQSPSPGVGYEVANFLAESAGFRTNPPRVVPDDVKATVADFLRQNGINPGTDPLQRYKTAQLDPSIKKPFEEANPRVRQAIEGERDNRIDNMPQLSSRQRRDVFGNARYEEDVRRDNRLRDLTRQFETGQLDANTYRKLVGEAQRTYFDRVRGAASQIFDERDDAKLDAILSETRRDKSPEERMLDELYSIVPEGDSFEAQKDFFKRRQAYIDSLAPEMRGRLEAVKWAQAKSIGPKYEELLRAQEQMAGLYKIPQYRGMTVEQSEATARRLAQARSMQQLLEQATGRQYPLRYVIVKFMGLSRQDQRSTILASMGRLRNAERDRYRVRQNLIGTYYSDLSLLETAGILDRVAA